MARPGRSRYAGHLNPRRQVIDQARRMLSRYRAAAADRTTADWDRVNYSPDGAWLPEAENITARARMAQRDDWQIKSIILAFQRHILGTGITARSVARNPDNPDRELQAFNREVDAAWAEFANDPKLVDLRGQDTLMGLIDVQIGDMVAAGNGFLVPAMVPRRDQVGLTLQAFEQEQLATELDTVGGMRRRGANEHEIRHGVELDPYGRPVRYHVHLRDHPLEAFVPERDVASIPAERVLHLRRQTRTRETLSPSLLTPALLRAWRNEQYDANEQLAKQMESFLAFAIKIDPRWGDPGAMLGQPGMPGTTGGEQNWGGGAGQRGSGEARAIDFSPGQVPVLHPGEELEMFHPGRPGPDYQKYMRTQQGMNAAGAGLDYSTVARDYSQSSYGSLRQGMLELWREIDPYQLRLVATTLRPIRGLFIEIGVMQGLFDAPRFFTDPRWRRAYLATEWMPAPRDWIDPAKEAAALKIQLDYYMTSRGRELNKRGVHVTDMLNDIARTRAAADRLGIVFPEDREEGPPGVSPSESKPHGVGDTPGGRGDRAGRKSGASPRTQSAGASGGAGAGDGPARGSVSAQRRAVTERMVEAILTAAVTEDGE